MKFTLKNTSETRALSTVLNKDGSATVHFPPGFVAVLRKAYHETHRIAEDLSRPERWLVAEQDHERMREEFRRRLSAAFARFSAFGLLPMETDGVHEVDLDALRVRHAEWRAEGLAALREQTDALVASARGGDHHA